ncbi:MAG: hypothetical protein K5765_05995 [Clostridia bacterium]|nr:hypothetical protein [Clostridia bacterium]
MSEINIKLLTEDCLAYLKENITKISELIKNNETNSWVNKTIPTSIYVEKKFKISDFILIDNPDSNDKDIDFKNSVSIYESLNCLPRYILCDERFWLWLHLDKFYPVVRNMMKIKKESTFRDHWLHSGGNRRGLMFGVLSRCYFRVALTIDENNPIDKYELTKWVIDNPERFRNLTWRSFSSEEHLVRGILKGEKRAIEENPSKELNSLYPKIAKYVSIIGSVRLLDSISEKDIEEMIYNKMKEYINTGVDGLNETIC